MAFTTLLLSLLTVATNAQQSSQKLIADETAPAVSPCRILASTFRGQVVHIPWERWESRSTCRFLPTDPRDIQEALADILIPHNASIAVTSGGRSSSAVDEEITIDLSRLSRIQLSDDHKSVSIGPGATWGDVYSKLEPLNLTVSGSMSAQDRVGGFVLGGGLSWFSNQYGWACDNVLEFEVVTPLGRKLWANMGLNQGLFWALKGSSGALGIVTKITVPTIHNGVIYGGALTFEAVHLPRLLQGIEDLAGSALDDSSNSGHLSLTWHASAKSFSYSSYIVNTASNQSASALMSFRAISHKTSSLRPMTIAESARELADIDSLPGTRRTYFTLTIRLNTKAMHTIHDVALVAARDMGIDANETCRVLFQPITIPHLLASYRKNVFDLNAAHGPLLLISVKMTWVEPERDEHFNHKTTALRRLIEEKMKRMEALEDFIHPLYAASDQDLFAQEEWKTSPNGRMLKAVAREYDPDEVWSKMVPGTWHV